MVNLKRNPIKYAIDEFVTLIHHISNENSPLEYVSADVFEFEPGGKLSFESLTHESCVVALAGKYTITVAGEKFENIGTRSNVFEKKPTDSLYVPIKKEIDIIAETKGRIIICQSPTEDDTRATRLIKASDNSIESRGKYNNQRLVHNILDDQSDIAEKLLVVEVYTDTANWSSYPPHKHDQNNLPEESFLEETYYHEVNPRQGFVFQRVYTDDKLIDETMTVNDGDVVLVPRGYHPVGVPDGYESYYLNIMAGPKKIWKFNNDLNHSWILDRK